MNQNYSALPFHSFLSFSARFFIFGKILFFSALLHVVGRALIVWWVFRCCVRWEWKSRFFGDVEWSLEVSFLYCKVKWLTFCCWIYLHRTLDSTQLGFFWKLCRLSHSPQQKSHKSNVRRILQYSHTKKKREKCKQTHKKIFSTDRTNENDQKKRAENFWNRQIFTNHRFFFAFAHFECMKGILGRNSREFLAFFSPHSISLVRAVDVTRFELDIKRSWLDRWSQYFVISGFYRKKLSSSIVVRRRINLLIWKWSFPH